MIEPIGNNGFRAKSGEPLPLRAEGATRDEALKKLRDLILSQMQKGAQIVPLEVASEDNPWLAMAGIFDPNDPLVQDWKEAMAEYRQKVENDPD